jgi:hypothetical protein
MSDPVSAEPDLIKDLLTKPIPKNLWHYTSHSGFKGIVESKSIYATDLRFLNDRQEFIHARDLALKLSDAVLDAAGIAGPFHETVKNAVGYAFGTGPLRPDRLQVMVASFSEAQDQLSQWRGYSGGSSGVSVSFDLSMIRPPYELQSAVVFAPCVYDPAEKEALILCALNQISRMLSTYTTDVFEEVAKDPNLASILRTAGELGPPNIKGPSLKNRLITAMGRVNFDLIRICPLLKDSSFAEEREWRLVLPISMNKQLQNHPGKFRPAKDTLIPYLEFPLNGSAEEPAPVNDLILGPGSHAEAQAAASSFLKAHKIMVKPRVSDVPYRPW